MGHREGLVSISFELKPSIDFFCSTPSPLLFRRCEVGTDPPSYILEAHASVLTPSPLVVTLHGLLAEDIFKVLLLCRMEFGRLRSRSDRSETSNATGQNRT